MWDRAAAKTFTQSEAKGYVGKTVRTSAGVPLTITGTFCDGPDSYILDAAGVQVYRSHNNCVYLIE